MLTISFELEYILESLDMQTQTFISGMTIHYYILLHHYYFIITSLLHHTYKLENHEIMNPLLCGMQRVSHHY